MAFWRARPPPRAADFKWRFWFCFVEPEVCHGCLNEVHLYRGTALEDARPYDLCLSKGPSLHVNWGPAREVAVHRLLAMTLSYREAAWPDHPPYDENLLVHHLDDEHRNNFLKNLSLMLKPDHARDHRLRR